MTKPSYLFYDIETTGLNKCFDQVLQFAAIRTDHELNEIARDEILIRLNVDIIPSPTAIITHRIGASEFQKGDSELDGIAKIHALLNTPNTMSVGYNSLGFDDEFLRFSFYKNLLPPYTHQYANQCGRMDMYPITLLYYLFKPTLLQWPTHNGSTNFKLENINTCNQLATGQAHNAIADVEATLALAKKLFQDQVMWKFVINYFQKSIDEERIHTCDSQHIINGKKYTTGFMVHGKIGHQSQFIAPVIYLGKHLHYKNQTLWLRLDDPNLTQTKPDKIAESTRILRKRLAESPIFLPKKERYEKILSPDRQKIIANNTTWLEKNGAIFNDIIAFYQDEKYPAIPERDAEAALYDLDFATTREENLFRQFHRAEPNKKFDIAEQFPNHSRKTLAMRILGRHFPDTLSSDKKNSFQRYVDSIYSNNELPIPIDFRGERKLTVNNALLEIDVLEKRDDLDAQQRALLVKLREYFRK